MNLMKLTHISIPFRTNRVFYGWWIVVIGLVVDGFKHGTFNRGFTLYILPIRAELGIGVAAIALADMLGRLEGGIMGPVVGYFTDKFGPGVMLAFGGIMSGVGFILLSRTGSLWFFTLVFVGFMSVGFRAGYNSATIPAVNQWFRRKRSLAMSIVSAGSGLGGVALSPLVGLLVFTLGWRDAALVSGIAIIVVVVPLSFLMRRSPENMGLLPDGDPKPKAGLSSAPGRADIAAAQSPRAAVSAQTAASRDSALDADYSVKEAMRSPSYWFLTMSSGLRNTVHSGISFLMAPVMVWFLQGGGMSEEEGLPIAAAFIGVLSLATLVFNVVVGFIGDRFSKRRISAICMAGGVLSMLVLLNHSGAIWHLLLFVVLLAFSESANPLSWSIMGDFFGRRSFATLRGWQHVPNQFMSMSTPVWMGWIYDQTGSYHWSLFPLAAIYGVAALFFWFLPSPRRPAGPVVARSDAASD
jgi:MFS family permease